MYAKMYQIVYFNVYNLLYFNFTSINLSVCVCVCLRNWLINKKKKNKWDEIRKMLRKIIFQKQNLK